MDSPLAISSAAVSDRGLSDKRPQNEDSYLEMRQSGIFAVADGVGGAQAGEVASQMAVEILGEAFANLSDNSDAETVMRTAIERANTAIYQMAHELPQLSTMATTIVALHLAENIATIGHVGDSRLYRLDRNGNIFRETDDHSMVAEEVRAGRMTEEQADNHPSRNVISRALGAELMVEPDLKTIMIAPGTAFLLCSDGVTRHMADQEIMGALTLGGAPEEICEYIKGLCYERGAEDNLTAVVIQVGGNETPITADEERTVATARAGFGERLATDEDDLLELDTYRMPDPPVVEQRPVVSNETIEIPVTDDREKHTEQKSDAAHSPDLPTRRERDSFTMFGGAAADDHIERSSSSGRIFIYLGILVLGGLLGFFAYHFAVPRSEPPPQPVVNPITEMASPNIPLTTFEKNRRNVDSDPAGYITKGPVEPQDSEDAYLLGRAYLLTGDYAKARAAFMEARKRLSEADPVNAKILADDIAMGLAVTNDTTIHGILKRELETSQQPANVNSNANSRR